MKILKIFALFSLFSNLLLFDANAVTHEKFKKQLKNTKDKINKLNKNSSIKISNLLSLIRLGCVEKVK